jgi:hypothetical protein
MWLVFFILVYLEVRGSVPAFAAWWIASILVAFGATVAATRVALRRSEASSERAPW